MKKILTVIALVAMMAMSPLCASASNTQQTVVAKNGVLSVQGRYIVNAKGEKVQLRGVSFGWHNWWHRYFNEGSVTRIAQEWKATIVRCSIGLDLDDNSYNVNPTLAYETVDRMVKAAVKNGIYVLIDFHSHANNLPLAKEFFTVVSKKYGKLPNVLFEIWNEPLEIGWGEAKAYSEEIIPIIRKNSNGIIIVPTPRWSQNVDQAADDPIVGYDNLVYSLHYYSATHKDDLRNKVKYAIGKGLPIFFAETGGMLASGDGVFDMDSWEEWLKLARENSISWIAWSLSDKEESCSMLVPNAPADGSKWTEADLKPWAVMVRHYLQIGM